MTEEKVNEVMKALRDQGYKDGEYKVTLTKELKIEPISPIYDLSKVLPYPISELGEGLCTICQRSYKLHVHLDYFVVPKHVKAIREFLLYLTQKHDITRNMYLKMGVEASDSVLSPKEIVLLLKDLAETNPDLANRFIPIFSHYIPSETARFEIQMGISRKLAEIEIHYDELSRKYQTELELHRTILGLAPNQETEAYNELVRAHEQNARIDYSIIQSEFHRVTSRVLAYEKLAQDMTKGLPSLKLQIMESMRKRRERPTPSFVFMPRAKKKQPVERESTL